VTSLDLIARRVVMSSMLYYGLDTSLWSDADYDEGCKRLVAEFDQLDPMRQWQLDSAEAISASGFKVKVTQAAAHGALAWLQSTGNNRLIYRTRAWRRPKGKPDFLLPSEFRWAD
jgi:hypothetical protein